MPSIRENNTLSNFAPHVGRSYPWRAMSIGAVLLALMLFLWAGIEFGYKAFLGSELQSLQEEDEALGSRITTQQEEEFFFFASQIATMRHLLAGHTRPSAVLSILEEHILPTVYYEEIHIDVPAQTVEIEGAATDYISIARQAERLRKLGEVEVMLLDNAKVGQGVEIFGMDAVVEFEMTIQLIDSVFHYSSPNDRPSANGIIQQ